jgi:alpha-1,2-mannosyltransferase
VIVALWRTRRSLIDELALPIGLAVFGSLLAWHAIHLWGWAVVGRTDFRILREATAEVWSGKSLYALRTVHGNLNPPHFHLIVLPFTWLAPLPAFFAWTVANVVALAFSLRIVVRELKISPSVVESVWMANAALLFSGTAAALWSGQSSFLLAWLATVAWRDARNGHVGRSGAVIGFLIGFKLFMLVFVPYWIFRRQLRALLAAGVTLAGSILIGVAIFGVAEHRAWVHTLGTVDWAAEPWNASLLAAVQRAMNERMMTSQGIWAIAAATILVFSLVRACRARGPAATDYGFACLLTGALLASPLGWVHYLWLAIGPLAACAYDAGRAFLSGWRVPVAMLAVAGLLCPPGGLGLLNAQVWGRMVFGSAYTWGLVALWVLLISQPPRAPAP